MKTIWMLFVTALLVGKLGSEFVNTPAPIADPVRDPTALQCYQAQRSAANIDIASRRVDYQRLDALSGCAKVSDLQLVPVTGAMDDAILLPGEAAVTSSKQWLIYDATGVMLDEVVNPKLNK